MGLPSHIDPARRLSAVKRVLLVGFLAGLLLSPRLWLSDRAYPLCPVSSLLPAVPHPFDYLWYALLLLLLAASFLLPRPGRCLGLFVGLTVLLCLWDQLRWQPWVYQYLVMTATLAVCYGAHGADQPERTEAALRVCRLIVAAIYFWSGLQKLNASFPNAGFAFLLGGILPPLPQSAYIAGGWLAALLEASIGIGLLTQRFRQPAVLAAVGMHVFILVCIGPWARDYNHVVWPWNVAMIGFDVILFWRTPDVSWRAILLPHGRAWHALVLGMFGIMPFFNFLDVWDSYFSANLYSGSVVYGSLFVGDGVRRRLPPEAQSHVREAGPNTYFVDLIGWSMAELNVPVNPERRIYRAIARQLCPLAERPDQLQLVIQERPKIWTEQRRVTKYDCGELE